MHPILFHVGSFPVRMYSLAIMTAFVAGTALCVWLARRRGIPWADKYADFMTWALVGGILGSRIWEVAFNWSYYGARPGEILAIWEGGLSVQGGIVGGLLMGLLFCRIHRIPALRFGDHLIPALALGQAIGRLLGCTFNGDAYGRPTGTSWGIVHAPGTNAYAQFGAQPLWPAEVFEGLFDLALMALFLRLGVNRGTPGRHFYLYFILYSAGRFGLEYLRADTGPVLAGLTAAQVGSLGAILAGALVILWLELSRGRRPRSAQEFSSEKLY